MQADGKQGYRRIDESGALYERYMMQQGLQQHIKVVLQSPVVVCSTRANHGAGAMVESSPL